MQSGYRPGDIVVLQREHNLFGTPDALYNLRRLPAGMTVIVIEPCTRNLCGWGTARVVLHDGSTGYVYCD